VLLASVVTAVPKQFFSLVQILQAVKCRIQKDEYDFNSTAAMKLTAIQKAEMHNNQM